MKKYYRLRLGSKNKYAEQCSVGSFIGADFGINRDLSRKLPDNWRTFNNEFIPQYLKKHPDKTKIAAGLAGGALWTVCKGIEIDDIVICPDGAGGYLAGKVTGDYYYAKGEILPHRRDVQWFKTTIDRTEASPQLRNNLDAPGTVRDVSAYRDEIETLIAGKPLIDLIPTDKTVEDPTVFALEKHLEDFLVRNWNHTLLGKQYDILEEEGELVGQQYPTDTGNIDILAISKDKKKLLVVELKKGRASDAVVGQIQRYMGFVFEELAEKNQQVKGVIIALEDDIRLRRSLAVASDIDFFRYKVKFTLSKA